MKKFIYLYINFQKIYIFFEKEKIYYEKVSKNSQLQKQSLELLFAKCIIKYITRRFIDYK